MRSIIFFFIALILSGLLSSTFAAEMATKLSTEEPAYQLGAGDVIRISVHNNPDLTLETRIPEGGAITFPLVGQVPVSGLTARAAEKKISEMLETGGFVKQAQVNIMVLDFQSKMVSVLGSANKPGRYPIERATSLTDLLALVGGANGEGSDLVTIIDKSGKKDYDLRAIVGKGDSAKNIALKGGEIVYIHAHDVSMLGQLNRPGKYSVTGGVRTLADFLAVAGGIAPNGSDSVIVNTMRDGKIQRLEVDVDKVFRSGSDAANIELTGGDTVYVARAPLVYVYGEVQRPGSYRVERDMTFMQALAQAGGLTARGTQRDIRLHRRNASGVVEELSAGLNDKVQQDDVIYVRESLF